MRLTREMTLFLVALVVVGGWGYLAWSGGVDLNVAAAVRPSFDPYRLEDWASVAMGQGLPTLSLEGRKRSFLRPESEVEFMEPLDLEMTRLIDLPVTMPPPSPRPGYDQLEGLRRTLVVQESVPVDGEEPGAVDEGEVPEDEDELDEPPQPGARKRIPPEEFPFIYDSLIYTSGQTVWGEVQDRSNRKWGKFSIRGDGKDFWWILKRAEDGRVLAAGNQSQSNVASIKFARTVENFHGERRSKVPEREPGRYDALMGLGAALEAETWRTEDDVQEALGYAAKSYREALETKKDDVPAILALASALRRRGEWEETLRLLEDAVKRVADVAVHVALGEVYETFDLPDLARATYEASLVANGTDARLRRRLADLSFAAGDLKAAADLYQTVVRFGAEEDEKLAAQFGLGRVALREGRTGEALDAVQKADQMSGEPVLEALGLKAAALYLAGKNAEAAEAARAALDLDDTYEPAVRTLGLALALQGSVSDARTVFEKARDADPFLYADSCFGLGFVSHLDGRAADAIEWYENAIAADPGNAYFHYLLGVSYRQDGRIEEAKVELETALRLAPAFLDVLRQLGLVHQALGSFTDSVRFLRRAVDLAPDDWRLRYTLASSLLRDQSLPRKARLQAASVEAEEILTRESDQPLALNLLGYVLYSLEPEDSTAARTRFTRVVNLVGSKQDDPDGIYAKKRLEEIRENESRVIWRDTFDGREINERWITHPPAVLISRAQDGQLRLDVRSQKPGEVLFYQWLKQQGFGELIEVTAEFVIADGADVNIGLAVTKRKAAAGGRESTVVGEIAIGRTFKGLLAMRARGPKDADDESWTPLLADPENPGSARAWPGDGGTPVRVTIRRTADKRRGIFDLYVNDELVAGQVEVSTLNNRRDVLSVGVVAMGQSEGGAWSARIESFEMVLER